MGQLRELKRLQKDNERLRVVISGLTLDGLILTETARGNCYAPSVAASASPLFVSIWAYLNAAHVERFGLPPAILRGHHPNRPKAGHALTLKLDLSVGGESTIYFDDDSCFEDQKIMRLPCSTRKRL